MKSCKDYKEMLSEYIDGTLPKGQREELESHLKSCFSCSEELHELRKTIFLVRSLPKYHAPSTLFTSVRERINKRKRSKSSLRSRLFPITSIAMVLIVIAAFFVYRVTPYRTKKYFSSHKKVKPYKQEVKTKSLALSPIKEKVKEAEEKGYAYNKAEKESYPKKPREPTYVKKKIVPKEEVKQGKVLQAKRYALKNEMKKRKKSFYPSKVTKKGKKNIKIMELPPTKTPRVYKRSEKIEERPLKVENRIKKTLNEERMKKEIITSTIRRGETPYKRGLSPTSEEFRYYQGRYKPKRLTKKISEREKRRRIALKYKREKAIAERGSTRKMVHPRRALAPTKERGRHFLAKGSRGLSYIPVIYLRSLSKRLSNNKVLIKMIVKDAGGVLLTEKKGWLKVRIPAARKALFFNRLKKEFEVKINKRTIHDKTEIFVIKWEGKIKAHK
ncbi:MAG: hypothetical protein DRG20_02625 [Deltaproteobacteria bacterium]|nr:MAG: hypothetical protein DRG20_02625 [Deltaproteobacteria bacterium]